MKSRILTFLVISCSLISHTVKAHSEVVGEIVFESFKNELYATARLDKRFLTGALMTESDCAPKNMMSVCGDEYVHDNISFSVNNEAVAFEKKSMEIQKNYVIITYQVKSKDERVKNIEVNSSYLFKYNDHAILRISFSIYDTNKSYSIKTSRRQIKAFFN